MSSASTVTTIKRPSSSRTSRSTSSTIDSSGGLGNISLNTRRLSISLTNNGPNENISPPTSTVNTPMQQNHSRPNTSRSRQAPTLTKQNSIKLKSSASNSNLLASSGGNNGSSGSNTSRSGVRSRKGSVQYDISTSNASNNATSANNFQYLSEFGTLGMNNTNDSAVKVFLRLRPMNEREAACTPMSNSNNTNNVDSPQNQSSSQSQQQQSQQPQSQASQQHLQIPPSAQCYNSITRTSIDVTDPSSKSTKTYNFDAIFANENNSQQELFDTIAQPICSACLRGFNGTIFAYGQTGSGKTYTIQGTHDHLDRMDGLMPQSIKFIYAQLAKLQSQAKQSRDVVTTKLTCSYVEIYNDIVYDLLDIHSERVIQLQLTDETCSAKNMVVEEVDSPEECYKYIERGLRNRRTAATKMNATSSRSHTIFTLNIEIHITNAIGERITRTSRLRLVDLAGSEKMNATDGSKVSATETKKINSSLSTLSTVISRLNEIQESNKISTHIPYRDSALTKLLRDSLGGNCLTYVIACASPHITSAVETLSTLRFAESARKIDNKPKINEARTPSAIISQLRFENMKLQKALNLILANIQNSSTNGNGESVCGSLDLAKMQELVNNTCNGMNDEEIGNLEEVRVLKLENEKLSKEKTELTESLHICEDKLLEKDNILKEARNTIDKLLEDKLTLQTTCTNLNEELTTANHTISTLQSTIETLQNTISTLESNLKDTKQELQLSEQKNTTLTNENASLQSQKQDLQHRVDTLSEKLVNALSKAKEYFTLSEKRQDQIIQLQNTIQNLTSKHDALDKEYTSVREQLTNTIQTHEYTIKTQNTQIHELEQLYMKEQGLNNELTLKLNTKCQEYDEYVQTSTQKIHTMEKEHSEFIAMQTQEFEEKLTHHMHMYEDLEAKHTVLRTQHDELGAHCDQLEHTVESLENTITKLEDDIVKLSGHHNTNQRINVLQQLKVENDEFKRENLKLKQQLANATRELKIATRPNIIPTNNNNNNMSANSSLTNTQNNSNNAWSSAKENDDDCSSGLTMTMRGSGNKIYKSSVSSGASSASSGNNSNGGNSSGSNTSLTSTMKGSMLRTLKP